jgi:hypothetical protein
MTERRAVEGEFFALLVALRDSRERALAAWAANEPLDNPSATAWLLNALHEAGAADEVAVLFARDPAAHTPLDRPAAVAVLLNALREAGAADQVAALATRAARPQPAATGTSPRWWKRFARPERRAKPKS